MRPMFTDVNDYRARRRRNFRQRLLPDRLIKALRKRSASPHRTGRTRHSTRQPSRSCQSLVTLSFHNHGLIDNDTDFAQGALAVLHIR